MAIRPTAMPMAATRPSPEMSLDSAASRQSMPGTTVSPPAVMAGPAPRRAPAPPQGHGHGLVPVGVPAQFLPVPGDQQQRVVGACADHEHHQDAVALPV